MVAAFLVRFARDLVGGEIPLDMNSAFRAVFILLALVAIFVRREWFHLANAIVALALFGAYVFAEFLRLR